MTNRIFATGLSQPEGPVVLPDGRIAVVEMGEDRKAMTIVAPDGGHKCLLDRSGNPNGLAVDGGGCFWVAGGPGQSLIRLSPAGEILLRVGGDGDRPFLWPNDLAFGPDGLIYMTDSGIAPEAIGAAAATGGFRDLEYDGCVYRIDPKAGKVVDKLAGGILFANGIAFGPDGALFYNETLTGMVYRIDGTGAPKPYANVIRSPDPAQFKGPDGMAFAADGTLYCAVMGEGHVCVVAPGGAITGRLATNGGLPTNVAFDLRAELIYVTEYGGGAVEMIAVDRPGLPLHMPLLD